MARAKKTARKSAKSTRRAAPRTRKAASMDAIALLKSDHREVESLFEQFESARSESRQEELARKICQALKVHTQIEHDIFYPAFLEATEEEDIHHEAEVEHQGAEKLISEIEASGPSDDYFHAKVTVLSEMIKHHVQEEEKRDGMFGKARQSDMDLAALGEQLAARKSELMGAAESKPQARRSRQDTGMQLGR
jgi:hemerythrin superfamily protein